MTGGGDSSVRFRCPHCFMRLMAPSNQTGTKRRCPRCQWVFKVPDEAEAARRRHKVEEYHVSEAVGPLPGEEQRYVSVRCPLCNTLLRTTEDQVGRQLVCPDCETRVVVPPPVEAPQQTSAPAASVEGYALSEEVDESAAGTRAADQTYFRFNCSSCDTMMQVTQSQVGQEIVCPDCQVPMVVGPMSEARPKKRGAGFIPAGEYGEYAILEGMDQPAAGSRSAHQPYIAVNCPICDALLHFTEDRVGREETCPDCDRPLVVPEAPQPVRKIDPREDADDPYEVGRGSEVYHHEPLFTHSRRRPRPGAVGEDGAELVLTPPRRPFVSGVFHFPLYRNAWFRWIAMSVAGAMVLGLALGALEIGSNRDRVSWITAMVLFGVTGTIGMLWAVTTITALLAILIDTAYGYDEIENWPSGTFGDWLVESAPVVFGLLLSMLPARGVAYALGPANLLSGLCLLTSFLVLFPILLLSMLETNSPLNPLSPPIWRSLLTARRAWVTFYLETAVLVIGGWYVVQALLLVLFPGGLIVASFVLVAGLMIYFRLLGRLAWFCRQRSAVRQAVDDHEPPDDEAAPDDSACGTGPFGPTSGWDFPDRR